LYITTITTHQSPWRGASISPQKATTQQSTQRRGCDSRSTKTFPKAREACHAQGQQASMRRKLTSERLEGEEAATMLFPSHHQAVRVQSSDAQTRLDRQLYTSTAANPSFEFCISQHEAAMQFSFQPAPTKPHGPHVGVSQSGAKAICQNRNTPAQTSPETPMRGRVKPRQSTPT
jgi:hypothetical protein